MSRTAVLIVAALTSLGVLIALLAPISEAAPGVSGGGAGGSALSGRFLGISCPSRSLCAAVDGQDVVYSTDPDAGGRVWHVTHIGLPQNSSTGSPGTLVSISCPSSKLCAAVDDVGDVITSRHPASGRRAWKISRIHGVDRYGMTNISCASAWFCVAVAQNGDDRVVSSTRPDAGAAAWKVVRLHNLPVPLTGISCTSRSFCAASDYWGLVVSSTNPTGNAGAWRSATIDPGTSDLMGISCPSTHLCAAFDEEGNVLTSANPTDAQPTWSSTHIFTPRVIVCHDGDPKCFEYTSLTGLSCSSAHLCVAVDQTGHAIASADPTQGAGSWKKQKIAPFPWRPGCDNSGACYGREALFGVACGRGPLCAAIGEGDSAFISTAPLASTDTWHQTPALIH
jgi:hypothetical protein